MPPKEQAQIAEAKAANLEVAVASHPAPSTQQEDTNRQKGQASSAEGYIGSPQNPQTAQRSPLYIAQDIAFCYRDWGSLGNFTFG